MIENLKNFLDSPEGEKAMNNFEEIMSKESDQEKRNYERFCRLIHKNGLDVMINKINNHYLSDNYINREYEMGFEPREPLNTYLLEYFEEFGEENHEDWGMFTCCQYQIDRWIVGLAVGQGSFIYVKEKKI